MNKIHKRQKLPLGIQTFSKLRTEGYLYIDKTKHIYNLLMEGHAYFLSRPRRFGKSLLLSTLEALFQGKRELFKDLWIYEQWQFEEYPIIKIDFSGIVIKEIKDLEYYISSLLGDCAEIYKLDIKESAYNLRFMELIRRLADSSGKGVVILIDEYDKPMIDYILDNKKAAAIRETLHAFYAVMKNMDAFIRFIFLTGVSKFSKTSIFSGLNNLRDLTVEDKYAQMLGYTREELEDNFLEYLGDLSGKLGLSQQSLLQSMEEWYDGYSWDGSHTVYNPLSILSLFLKQRFHNYWFATGTPSFLIDLIRRKEFNLPDLENLIAGSELLDSFDVDQMFIEAILFQTGYLTIKNIQRKGVREFYQLGYPNYEVKESLLNVLFASYMNKPPGLADMLFYKMGEDLEAKDIQSFFERLRGIISGIPYNMIVEQENYYSSLIYTILALAGIRAEFEVQTATGRLDAQIEFKDKVYIFEFKYDKPCQEALDQIISKGYADKYKGKGKDVIMVGVGFNRGEKIIEYCVGDG